MKYILLNTFIKLCSSGLKRRSKHNAQGKEPKSYTFCTRNIHVRQTSPPGTCWKFSWKTELPYHLNSLLFWFKDSILLNPCQGLEDYPQNKLLDRDLKLSLSKAQAIARHTHWLETVFLPLAIIFIMLSYRLFYSHDLITKCQSMHYQMPQGEIFKSLTLTGREIRAYFNF